MLPLALAGGRGWLEEGLEKFIDELGLTNSVFLLGYVNDAQLRWLYRNCWAFCFPSRYEGFGLPVLEAMSMRAAVMTSGVTSLPEIGGDAFLYVNPFDVDDITRGFNELAGDRGTQGISEVEGSPHGKSVFVAANSRKYEGNLCRVRRTSQNESERFRQ